MAELGDEDGPLTVFEGPLYAAPQKDGKLSGAASTGVDGWLSSTSAIAAATTALLGMGAQLDSLRGTFTGPLAQASGTYSQLAPGTFVDAMVKVLALPAPAVTFGQTFPTHPGDALTPPNVAGYLAEIHNRLVELSNAITSFVTTNLPIVPVG